MTLAPPAPTAVATAVAALASRAHRIVVVDASALAADPHDVAVPGPVTLADLSDPHRAAGNCLPATTAVTEHLRDLTDATLGTAEAWFDSGHSRPGHVATTLALTDGDVWVVDFTARQFDPTCPVPLVVPVGDWVTLLTGWADAWGWRLIGDPGRR